MTTVSAVQTEDDVLLAWDSKTTHDNEQYTSGHSKVFCKDGIVFGISGYTRVHNLIYSMDLPEYDGSDARKWINKKLIPAIKAEIIETGSDRLLLDPDDGTAQGWGWFVIVDGIVFLVDSTWGPNVSEEGVYGLGSGADYAKGAYYAGVTIKEAVEIASSLDPYSGGPINYSTASELIINEELDPA